ncbi:MAG: carboxylesterase family protein, partial [Halioglobus sp.]
LIIGSNAEETGIWVKSADASFGEQAYQALVRSQFGEVLGDLVLARYVAQDYASPADAFVAVSTDSQFICPARRVAQDAAAHSQPVYVYRFAKAFESTPLAAAGAYHGIELFYLFQKVSELPNYLATAGDRAVEVEVAAYWSGFAATGDPNSAANSTAGDDAGNGVDSLANWPAYNAAEDSVLQISANTQELVEPRAAQCDFWQGLRGG